MLALFLDRYGVRSVIFNTEAEVRPHPKGSSHNSRTMEHHRRLGNAPRIRDLCLPINNPTDVSYYTRLTGWELARIKMPSEADKRRTRDNAAATDQIVEPLLRANQMYVECFLFEHGLWLWFPVALVWAVVWCTRQRSAFVAAVWQRLPACTVLAAIAFHTGYYILKVGGDHFELRPLDFYWPPLAVAAVEGILVIGARFELWLQRIRDGRILHVRRVAAE